MFWSELSDAGRQALLDVGTATTFRSGAKLFHEGEPSDHVFVLLSGVVKLTKLTVDGRQVLIELRRTGEVVGELTAIDRRMRSASVSAMTNVRALVISAARFRSVVISRPELAEAIMRVLADKVRQSSDRRIEAAANTAIARVSSRLSELAEEAGSEADETIQLTTLTQQELANWIGLSRERIAQALRDLRTLGWIDTSRRVITVLDLPALQEAASGQS